MSYIFYYSNYCKNCSPILKTLSSSNVKNDIHFISIDNRVKKSDGKIYLIMANKKEIILPHTVDKVPALLLLNRGNQVIFGNEIINHLQPQKNNLQQKMENEEPSAFSFNGLGACGVSSDNYSFLDQSIDDLSAKGNGGLRQLRNNVTWETLDTIETPPDNYEPNKIGEVSMEKLQRERESSLKS